MPPDSALRATERHTLRRVRVRSTEPVTRRFARRGAIVFLRCRTGQNCGGTVSRQGTDVERKGQRRGPQAERQPLDAPSLARIFTRARMHDVRDIAETLVSLGQARRVEDRYIV